MPTLTRLASIGALFWYIAVLTYSTIYVFGGGGYEYYDLIEQAKAAGQLTQVNTIAIVPFLLAAYGINFHRIWAATGAILKDRVFFLFTATVIVVGMFHAVYWQDDKNIRYTLLLVALLPAFVLIWRVGQEMMRALFLWLARALAGYLVLVPLMYGLPRDRLFSGAAIHPNFYGGVAMMTALCAILSGTRRQDRYIYFSILAAGMVQSRYALLAILVMFFMRKVIFGAMAIERKFLMYAIAALIVVGLVFDSQFDFFQLASEDRGLGTGFTGRTESWAYALSLINQDPYGYGFKSSILEVTGHNGFLNLALQFGVVPGILITVLFMVRLRSLWREQRSFAGASSDVHPRDVFICLTGFLIAGFFQPQIINFGDSVGLLFLLLFARPSAQRATQVSGQQIPMLEVAQG